MSEDEHEPDERGALPNSALQNPADLTELSPDGPRRTAPLFDDRPAVLKNPAELPPVEPDADRDLAFAKLSDDLDWVDKSAPTDEEIEARRLRHEAYKKRKRRQRRTRKALRIGAAVLLVIAVLTAFWFRYTFGGMERMPSVHGQAGVNTPGENFLLVGTNPGEPARTGPRIDWKDDFTASDLVMLIHVSGDKRSAFVISIPHDAALPLAGGGTGRLTDAFAAGGAKAYVRTVEEFTGARLDRVFTLDLNALRQMADIFEGVVVNAPTPLCGETAGPRRVDGLAALEYISLRSCMPGKDLDRVARQQSLMKALMRSAVDGGTVTHPWRVNKLLRAGAGHSTLEDGFGYPSILGTLFSFRHLRTANTTFLTVPVADRPYVTRDGVDYVRLDEAENARLWEAVRTDSVAQYLQLSGVPVSP